MPMISDLASYLYHCGLYPLVENCNLKGFNKSGKNTKPVVSGNRTCPSPPTSSLFDERVASWLG